MSSTEEANEGDLILDQTQEGTVRIPVLYQSETFWLNQKKIAELFGVDLRTLSKASPRLQRAPRRRTDRSHPPRARVD